MKVWVVESHWCDETSVLGVFSSREKADAFFAKQSDRHGYTYHVEAYEVDDESHGDQVVL